MRATGFAAVGLLAAGLLAGCGSTRVSGPNSSTAPVQAPAGVTTSWSPTPGPPNAVAIKTYDRAELLAAAITAAGDQRKSVLVDLDLGGIGTSACQRRTAPAPAVRCELKPPGSAASEMVSYVMAPEALYVQVPQAKRVQDAKPWLKLDPADQNPLAKPMAAVAEQIRDRTDPRTALPPGAKITGTVQEKVDGKDAVRYTVTAGQTKTVLWTDAQDLPVRIEFDSGTGRTAAAFHEWSTPVDIQPPPAAQLGQLPPIPAVR